MVYGAVARHFESDYLVIILANLMWTIAYMTIMYAMVDRDDDVKIGVKSTAILFGRARPALHRIIASSDVGAVSA